MPKRRKDADERAPRNGLVALPGHVGDDAGERDGERDEGRVGEREYDVGVTLGSRARARSRAAGDHRVITLELAHAFAEAILSDEAHTVQSAAVEVGLVPNTVRNAIGRYRDDGCTTDEDREICRVLFAAKERHLKQIRAAGRDSSLGGNNAGVSWAKWQLEVQDPTEHARPSQRLEHTGGNGGPILLVGGRRLEELPDAELEAFLMTDGGSDDEG